MPSLRFRIAASRVCITPKNEQQDSKMVCAENLKEGTVSAHSVAESFTNHVVEIETDTDVSALICRSVPFSFPARLFRHWPLIQESAHTLWWSGTLSIIVNFPNELNRQEEGMKNGGRCMSCIVSVS